MDRRHFLKFAAALGAAGAVTALPRIAAAGAAGPIKAVLFDAFPIFDPRPVFAMAKAVAPAASGFAETWRTRQFEYTWLRTVGSEYQDFWSVTRDALRFAAKASGISLSGADEDRLMGAYLELGVWPDVLPALQALKAQGLRLAFLSNFTAGMLQSSARHAGIASFFDGMLSTDAVRRFKPHPDAYRLGLDALGIRREEAVFAAFAGWDAAGARWFGYPTFWVNRMGQAAEELGAPADMEAKDLTGLAGFVSSRSSAVLPRNMQPA